MTGLAGAGVRQIARHADHLERLLAQVVRLLRVEREDAVGELGLGDQERDDGLAAQLLERVQAVVAVGRPVGAVFAAHGDDRVEEAADLVHALHEALQVRLGEVALEGRGGDLVDRQRDEELPLPAERLPVGADDGRAVGFDQRGELFDRSGRTLGADFARTQSTGGRSDLLATSLALGGHGCTEAPGYGFANNRLNDRR